MTQSIHCPHIEFYCRLSLSLLNLWFTQFKLRTELDRTIQNQFYAVQFSSQFGLGNFIEVWFSVQQKVPRTGLNRTLATLIKMSTLGGYAMGTWNYMKFCLSHHIALDPTPKTLVWYIAFTSNFIASGPKYLTGVHHFLKDLYPDFNTQHAHPLVRATIQGSKKT